MNRSSRANPDGTTPDKGCLTRDGTSPDEIAAIGRAQLLAYPNMTWIEGEATEASGRNDEERAQLASREARIEPTPVVSVASAGDGIAVTLADGVMAGSAAHRSMIFAGSH